MVRHRNFKEAHKTDKAAEAEPNAGPSRDVLETVAAETGTGSERASGRAGGRAGGPGVEEKQPRIPRPTPPRRRPTLPEMQI